MSGLREDEPIVLDDDDSQSIPDNGENMPSTSGTQRKASNDVKEETEDTCSDAESCVYVVEAIRAKRFNKDLGIEEYLIKWVDYPEKDNTWEPIAHLKCETLLKEFEEKESNKPKRRKTTVSRPQSAKKLRRDPSSVDGSEATLEDQQEQEKLFLESDEDDDDVSTQRSRKGDKNHRKTAVEPVGVKGFARGLPLESIINGVFGDDHKLFFFVKWLGEDALEMVSAEELKKNGAIELCNWYEKRLFWKNGIEPDTGDNPTDTN